MDRRAVERTTLAVLSAAVATLALSDFVRPVIWLAALGSVLFRFAFPSLGALSERAASVLGWLALLFACGEMILGTAWIEALADFLLLLALVIVWEEPCPRNDLHRLLVAGFLVLASTVLTDSVLLAIPLSAWAVLTLLAAMRIHAQGFARVPPRLPPRLLLLVALAGLVLFIIAPRAGTNPWLAPRQPRQATTGFADVVRLGSFARSESTRIVMRAEMPGLPPARARRLLMGHYWRGAVLSLFTGHDWRRLPARTLSEGRGARALRLAPGPVQAWIAVYREPVDHAFLILPEHTARIRGASVSMAADDAGEIRFLRTPAGRMRLLAGLSAAARRHLRPPVAAERSTRHLSPTVRRFVARFAALPPARALAAMQAEMRTWNYALDARPDPRDPIGWFLRHRRGHCELYASAFALAARVLGLPSRVVTGYFGGQWNGVGHYLALRERDAHAWAEVWLEGRWQRFDPTPPVRWRMGRGSGLGAMQRLAQAWDAVRLAWYRYVLSFDAGTRARLVAALRALAPWLPWFALLVALAVLRRLDVRARLLDVWLRWQGVVRIPGVPLRTLPVFADPEGRRFVRRWEAARYGQAPEIPWVAFLRTLWRLSRRRGSRVAARGCGDGTRRARARIPPTGTGAS